MESVKISKDMTIKLPVEMKKIVSVGDEFVVSIMGDSLRLKKVKKPEILDLAASKKDKKAPTIEEISRIVHAIRGVRNT